MVVWLEHVVHQSLLNKELIKQILPQQNRKHQNNIIITCIERRIRFNRGETEMLCTDYSDEKRESHMYMVIFYKQIFILLWQQ